MKKNLLIGLAALAAVTTTSCQKDQVINQVPQEQAIEFGTYVGRDAQTKGSVTDINTLCGDANNTKGFGVFAYYTGTSDFTTTSTPNFMYNQRVYGTASGDPNPTYTWAYSPIKYWPNNEGDKISFFAYAPYITAANTNYNITALPANTTQGDPKLTFVMDPTISTQVDLVYADPSTLKNIKKPVTGTKTTFNFKHALSRISFSSEALVDQIAEDATGTSNDGAAGSTDVDSKTTITIKSITLNGVFYKKGILNLADGTWAKYETPSSYVINTFESGKDKVTKTKTENITGFMMIIPDDFGTDQLGAQINRDLSITVVYDVETNDTALEGQKSTITNTIESSDFKINFQQGKAYNFALHLGMETVKFEATVSPWDESNSDIAVNVPINTTPPVQNNN